METNQERPIIPQSIQTLQETPPRKVVTGASTDTNADVSSNHDPEEEYKALSETKPPWAVLLVVIGILMSLFLVALDRTIVSTVRIGSLG
jgi:hypothetical protein